MTVTQTYHVPYDGSSRYTPRVVQPHSVPGHGKSGHVGEEVPHDRLELGGDLQISSNQIFLVGPGVYHLPSGPAV